ncbi:MAG: hypothetical protein LBS00_00815 [Synergistaceae bacterium]|nr:hypothetical protein [Synergistaceae bacterium]
MDKAVIAQIAKDVLKAFLGLQQGLADGTLTTKQLEAIDSLPTGEQDRCSSVDESLERIVKLTGRSRLTQFPEVCCADATAALGTIYTMAGVTPSDIVEVKVVQRKKNRAFNFHKWLSVEGLAIDITLGQFHPLSEHTGNAVALYTHPFEGDPTYTIERTKFIIPTPIVKFAEYIGYTYVFEPQAGS